MSKEIVQKIKKIVKEAKKNKKSCLKQYSQKDGTYYSKPIEVIAVMYKISNNKVKK